MTKKRIYTQPPQPKQKKRKLLGILFSIFTVIAAIIPFRKDLKEFIQSFRSDHEAFVDETRITIPVVPYGFGDSVVVRLGNSMVSTQPLSAVSRTDITGSYIWCTKGDMGDPIPAGIALRRIDRNLIVFTFTVRDLKTGEVMIRVVDNKVEMMEDKIFDYESGPNGLDIIDRYGNVALSFWLNEKREFEVRGYFTVYFVLLFLMTVL